MYMGERKANLFRTAAVDMTHSQLRTAHKGRRLMAQNYVSWIKESCQRRKSLVALFCPKAREHAGVATDARSGGA